MFGGIKVEKVATNPQLPRIVVQILNKLDLGRWLEDLYVARLQSLAAAADPLPPSPSPLPSHAATISALFDLIVSPPDAGATNPSNQIVGKDQLLGAFRLAFGDTPPDTDVEDMFWAGCR